ncbi:pyridoxal phosphate-dependent aminotransferase [Nostoc sp. CHAB 5784]|uniref:pyridoxal phosphate-dependent aminotransferase n=1 Tax=Nostoc mirabile TaxID=2907820 RepID=UPI001E2B055D|nr:pyridoxal phosphate-dependent aminotransferase [Nostoc mirabile]MCC5669489.1 pyridoxal phosphate-dependent aminotransferase [Nostoc mirabile CHAB5784]
MSSHILKLADSLGSLGTERAFEVLARAKELERQGKEVIHLEIGEPDFDTPAHACAAAYNAMLAGETHYCPSAGILELRETVAEYFSRTRGIPVNPSRVLVANGARAFLFFTILATCNPGDEVIYPNPSYPIYESVIRWVGAKPIPLRLREEINFAFDLEEFANAITSRTKLIILNSPHNPTGSVLNAEQISNIGNLIRDSNAWILSDEIYSQIVYDGQFSSIASDPSLFDRTVVLEGLSKTYAMTGWRCGFATVPELLVEPLTRFFINSMACVPPFIQRAGVEVMRGSQSSVMVMLEEFRSRRDLMVEELNRIDGISCRVPSGAFYVFPNIQETGWEAEELAAAMLDEIGVAVLAGTSFGDAGRYNLRISYANSEHNLRRALVLIKQMLTSSKPS